MISIEQFQEILAGSLFEGDAAVAGIVILAVTLLVLFAVFKKNHFASLLTAIPVTFVYSMLGVVSADMMIIMIVICVLGLATVSKKTLGE